MSAPEDEGLSVLVYHGYRSLVIDLPCMSTINELKQKLADLCQIPVQNQRIFYCSTQVTKDQTLADFKCPIICLALVEGPVSGGGPKKNFSKIHPHEIKEWLDAQYEESLKRGDGVLKSELFDQAANHFDIEKNTSNQRVFFECLGRHVFGKHPSFKNVKLTKGKKIIKGIIRRSYIGLAPADPVQNPEDEFQTLVSADHVEYTTDHFQTLAPTDPVRNPDNEFQTAAPADPLRNPDNEFQTPAPADPVLNTNDEFQRSAPADPVRDPDNEFQTLAPADPVQNNTDHFQTLTLTDPVRNPDNEFQTAAPADPVQDPNNEVHTSAPADPFQDPEDEFQTLASADPVENTNDEFQTLAPADPVENTNDEFQTSAPADPVQDPNNEVHTSAPADPVEDPEEEFQTIASADPVQNTNDEFQTLAPADPVENTNNEFPTPAPADPLQDPNNEVHTSAPADPVQDLEDEFQSLAPTYPVQDTDNEFQKSVPVSAAAQYYCNKAFLKSRSWNNFTVKEIGPEELGVSSFKEYLEELLQFPSSRRSNEERLQIYKDSSYGNSHLSNCVRVFLTVAFPPIIVCKKAANELPNFTFVNDVMPQFIAVCSQSPRNRTRVSIKCTICPHYEALCVKRGMFNKLSKVNHHRFDGVAQAIDHQKTKVHQMAASFFTGSSKEDFSLSTEDTSASKQRTIFEALKIKERDSRVTQCLGFYQNKQVVESFKEDVMIRRISPKLQFERQREKGKYQCYLEQGHGNCVSWSGWKAKHPEEAQRLSETRPGRAVYLLLNRGIIQDGIKQKITGTIKSLDPPCTAKPSGHPKHPFTCDNCHKQEHYLVDLFNKRSEAKLKNTAGTSRIGERGFRHDYAKKTEVKATIHSLSHENKNASRAVSALKKRERSVQSWEEMLHESCKHGYQEKLIIDLLTLFKQDVDETRPVQTAILTNLVGKLAGTVNHQYIPLIKTIGKMHKIRLGECNYRLTKDLFGLPCGTTCDKFRKKETLEPGYNSDVLNQAACLYLDGPVIEASDEARALRFLQAVQNEKGEVILIGNSWSGDVDEWDNDVLQIPRKNKKLGDVDDFSALQRTVQGLIDNKELAAKVAVHNFCNLHGERSQPLVYLMWPTPKKGYSGSHLLKIWQKVRKDCAEKRVNLIGHSTDSAGFSLSASIQLMTPTESTVARGIQYLGLGILDERFVAPYFWRLPSISYGDYDHLRRTFLRVLKYDTRDLTFFKDARGSIVATVNHLQELMSICQKNGQGAPFSANDLLLISFFDQRPDTANRIFTLEVVEMLQEYVKGSEGTCLYLTAVYYLTEPFFDPNFGTPKEIQKALSTGIMIFRLWKRYLEVKKMKLHSQANAAKLKEKRGHFITYGAYTTAELLFSAGSLHCLAMYLHFKHLGPKACSLNRSGTIATERIIGQLQGKTNQLQSLDTAPTFAEMITKTKDLKFLTEALSELGSYEGIKIPATSNRKLSHFRTSKIKPDSYKYPITYEQFLKGQQKMHKEGVKAAQTLVQEYLPSEFQTCLIDNNWWELPYTFPKPENIVIVSGQTPTYEKLDVSVDAHLLKEVQSEVDKENLVEREEKCILFTADCGIDYREADVNETNVDSVMKSDEGSDQDKHVEEKAKKNLSQGKQKWYIERNGEMIHINKALKLLIPRELISKERSRRHWVANDLHKTMAPIDQTHDVIQYRDVAVANGGTFFILHILSISSEEGKELISTSSRSKCFIRGLVYKDSEYVCNQYGFMTSVFVSKWLPVRKVICEVTLKKNENGLTMLSEDSQMDLEEWSEKSVPLDDDVLQSSEENNDVFYEVENILDVRLNRKYHSEEYKVRFKGYGPEDDMWLPSSSFREPVQFQTVSQRGRVRKHTTKDETDSPQKKVKLSEAQKHKTKESKERWSNEIEGNKSKSLDNLRKRGQQKRKNLSFQKHGRKKSKCPVEDIRLEETNDASENSVDKDSILPMAKPSSSTKTTKKGDRGLKRKRQKSKPNGYKFRQSLVTSNSFEVTSTDSDNESCPAKKNSMKQGSVARERYLPSLTEEITTKPSLNLILPQEVQGINDIVAPSMVCSGSFHQSQHEDFHYPGQQCSAIALTALLYTTVKPIDTWRGSDVDHVLIVGDTLHFLQLCHLRRSVNSVNSKLALDELPSNVQCFKFQFSIKTSITGGTIDKKEAMSADDLAGLEDIFENCQECKAVGVVLRILEYTIACAHSYNMWYIMDSHARDSTGMIDDHGSSVVLQFPDYMSLLHYIRRFFENATSERVLNQNDLSFETMTLEIKERKPVQSDERLILPIQPLMTYRTSLGGIDLMNTFAICLENGKEVNDDLLDFFLLFTAETHLDHIKKKQIFIYNSCFYKKLSQFNPHAIRRWTKNTDIFNKKYLFIPICKDSHWLLVIVNNDKTTSIMILDSLNGTHGSLERTVKRYLQDEWAAKEKQQPSGMNKNLVVEEVHYPVVPKQTNDKDCGLYVMKCFEEFLKDIELTQFESWRPVFSPNNITFLRKNMKFSIQEEISKLH